MRKRGMTQERLVFFSQEVADADAKIVVQVKQLGADLMAVGKLFCSVIDGEGTIEYIEPVVIK